MLNFSSRGLSELPFNNLKWRELSFIALYLNNKREERVEEEKWETDLWSRHANDWWMSSCSTTEHGKLPSIFLCDGKELIDNQVNDDESGQAGDSMSTYNVSTECWDEG